MYLETKRLIIRELTLEDAPFVLTLLNSEAFIVNIGDRGIYTLEQAQQKINSFYTEGYPSYGLFVVELEKDKTPIGTVSYLKRPFLDHDDIGYAFLPQFWHKGYALEATKAVLEFKINQGTKVILGVVDRVNTPSVNLLTKLNFIDVGDVVMLTENTTECEQAPIMKMEYRV